MDAFSKPDFDPNEYAHAILSPTASGGDDISAQLAKLNFGIDDVASQLKSLVTDHHEALLQQTAGIGDLEGSFKSVRAGLDEVTGSLEKLRVKIRLPYQSLASHVLRLQRLQQATDLLRRIARFVIVARRLSLQMTELDKATGASDADAHPHSSAIDGVNISSAEDVRNFGVEGEQERTVAKAALSVAELVSLLDEPDSSAALDSESDTELDTSLGRKPIVAQARIPLRVINVVMRHVPELETAKARVASEMESMVSQGLSSLNQSLLASSLQTAHNLLVLPQLVQSIVSDLSTAVDSRIKTALDLSRLSKDVAAKEAPSASAMVYKSRLRTEPTALTAPQWTAVLWSRLELLMEELASHCVKVYTLERVLRLKKDPVSQVSFLDEALTLLENKPSSTFWTTLSRSLEKHCKDAAKGSNFIQQTLSTGYPRLLRLFHEFFAKIGVHTDTVYSLTYQSPETVITLRAISHFEALYLSRAAGRMAETSAAALASGARSPPTVADAIAVARAFTNELDAARFDPLLVRAVARSVNTTVDNVATRADSLIVKDRTAITLLGPTATPQQTQNAQLVTFLYQCGTRLSKLQGEYPEHTAAIFAPSVRNIQGTYTRAAEPLLAAIRREASAIIARLHRVALGKGLDSPMMGGGASPYMKELVDKLAFIHSEVLGKYNVDELQKDWVSGVVRHIIRTFVLHVSIARPLGESGKLQLTSDMTELEFALNSFMTLTVPGGAKKAQRPVNLLDALGDEYRMLRALRQLLFLDNAALASREATQGMPSLVILHHIIVRSPLQLPHSLHGWQEAEYVKWVDEHTPNEAWSLIETALAHWEKVHDGEPDQGATEYIELARTVLANARAVRS